MVLPRAAKSTSKFPVSPFSGPEERFAAGRMGMNIFLLSVGMLFAASLIGYFVIRLQPYFRDGTAPWPGDLPLLPRVLLLSTLVLAVSSAAMQSALSSVRAGRIQQLKAYLTATFALGCVFLLMQARAWIGWLTKLEGMWEDSQPHRWALASFYVLTGIHAAHVIGGLIPMLVVAIKSWRGAYTANHYPGVHYCAMYWHFLGAVWIVLYLTLLVGT
jgi:cytochrome c oxidase subunit III